MREYFLFAIILAIHPINTMDLLTKTEKIAEIISKLKAENIVADETEIRRALDREERFVKREKAVQKDTPSNTFDFTPESIVEYAATRSGVED